MEIDDMKNSLERFAKDFTKLSEYFGVDDYDNIEAKRQKSTMRNTLNPNQIRELENENDNDNFIEKLNKKEYNSEKGI